MTEKQLHANICYYLKSQYKNVLFNTDMSGIKLTLGQAVQAKKLRSDKGYPDIIIYEIGCFGKPIDESDISFALFLEVKKEIPFKKDGTFKKSKHLQEQARMHQKLRQRGYEVEFVWTFEMAKEIIDDYLNFDNK